MLLRYGTPSTDPLCPRQLLGQQSSSSCYFYFSAVSSCLHFSTKLPVCRAEMVNNSGMLTPWALAPERFSLMKTDVQWTEALFSTHVHVLRERGAGA